jgi:hypothetical protein
MIQNYLKKIYLGEKKLFGHLLNNKDIYIEGSQYESENKILLIECKNVNNI